MKIPFQEIVKRITGISTPIGGLTWSPPRLDADVAKELLTFLEDRRVLYKPYELEVPDNVVRSVFEIRAHLTDVLAKLDRESPLAQSIAAMRVACRKFIDQVEPIHAHRGSYRGLVGSEEWVFFPALGELRGIIGVHIANICVRYGIDIEKELATILPADPDVENRPL